MFKDYFITESKKDFTKAVKQFWNSVNGLRPILGRMDRKIEKQFNKAISDVDDVFDTVYDKIDTLDEDVHPYEDDIIKFQEAFGKFVIATSKVNKKAGRELPKIFKNIEDMIADFRKDLKGQK